MKITHDGESACFIATLNTTNTALPSAVLNATATVTNSMILMMMFILGVFGTHVIFYIMVTFMYKHF